MSQEEGVRIPIRWQDLEAKHFFACEPPPVLYHYTNYDGANGILASKSLWLTHIRYLNDTSELHFAIKLFRDVTVQKAKQISDVEKREFLETVSGQLESFSRVNICVGSFCENGDLLSQWRAYGDSGNGVAIGFQGRALNHLSNSGRMNLWKCVYNRNIQAQIINNLADNLLSSYDIIDQSKSSNENWNRSKTDLIGYFNATFLRIAPVLKDCHFKEEQEWRLITVPIPNTDKEYHARITNNRVAEYYVVDLDKSNSEEFNFIESIVVGPTSEMELVADAFWVLLKKYGYKCKEIRSSWIPYRAR